MAVNTLNRKTSKKYTQSILSQTLRAGANTDGLCRKAQCTSETQDKVTRFSKNSTDERSDQHLWRRTRRRREWEGQELN